MSSRRLYLLATMLICYSYGITTVIVLRSNLPTGATNFIIKLLLAILSAVGIFTAIPYMRKATIGNSPLLIFFAVYGCRLLYDVLVCGITTEYQSATYVLGYFFGLTMLPVTLVTVAFRTSDRYLLYCWIFGFLVAANLSLLLHILTGGEFSLANAVTQRAEVRGDIEGTAVLNPLLFGLDGVLLTAFVLGVLTTAPKVTALTIVTSLPLLGLGLTNIVFSASRGPTLALGVVLTTILITIVRQRRLGKYLKISPLAWLSVAVVISMAGYFFANFKGEMFLLERFTLFYQDRASGRAEERDLIYSLAWNDFLGSPLIGNSYIVSVGAYSPHNIILEALMSTGVFGTIFFVLGFAQLGICIRRLLNGHGGREGFTIALLALCYCTLALTSSSIRDSPDLWIFVILVSQLGAGQKHATQSRSPHRSSLIDNTSLHRPILSTD